MSAQSGNSCISATSIQNIVNVLDTSIKINHAINWYYFQNDSTYITFDFYKSKDTLNLGKVYRIQIFNGNCNNNILLFDTTITHGTNTLFCELANQSSGNIILKIENMDTINCIPCKNPYNLGLSLKNSNYPSYTWPAPYSTICPNIITNPSFELTSGTIYCQGISAFLNNWTQINNSPDWLTFNNSCTNTNIPNSTWFGTIANPPTSNIANPNNAYVGVVTALYSNQFSTWVPSVKEKLQQIIPILMNSKRYLVRAKVALAPGTQYTSNNMNVRVCSNSTITSSPQLSAPMLTIPNTWVQLENSFVSNGTENRIIVGNNSSSPNGSMNTLVLEIDSNSNRPYAYYFADDIELYRMADAGPDVTISTCSPPQIGTCAIPGAAYLWTPATGLSSAVSAQPFAMPTQTTQYVVRVIYQLLNGNTAIDYDTVIVTVPPCNCFANAGPNITILDCIPDTIGPDCIHPNLSYSWTPSLGLSDPNVPNPTALPGSLTQYVLTVSYTDPFSGYVFNDYDTVEVNVSTQLCVSNIIPNVINPSIYANNIGTLLSSNVNCAFDGTIYINITNFTISNNDLVLGPNSKIVVFPNCTLTISNSYLHGCCAMWHGIKLMQNSALNIIDNTIIEDADTAITVRFNGVYNLTNSVFNKNYVDVAAIGSINLNQTASINSCTFDCNDIQMPGTYNQYGLRPPFLGHRSAIAISALNVNPITVGTGPGTTNYFYNHDWGLFFNNTTLNANNNFFNNIDDNSINTYPFSTPKGINIHLENTNGGNYFSNIYENTFINGVTAINAIHGYNGQYLGNSITGMSNFGIVFFENTNKTFRINSNIIDNVAWVGIYSLNNYNTHTNIYFNEIYNSLDKLYRTAIGLDETIFASAPGLRNITGNKIYNLQYGITTTRLVQPKIYSNEVNIQHTPWGIYAHGIRLFENERALVIGNTIFGNYRYEYFVDGIRSDNGNAADLRCNYTIKTGSGAFFAGSSIFNAILRSNIFLKDFWGVVLANQAAIGSQGTAQSNESYANQWIGSMGNPDYAHTFAYFVDGTQSPFYTLAGYPWEPIVAGFNPGSQPTSWGAVSSNLNDNCLLYRDSIDTNVVIISPINEPLNETQLLQQINTAQSSNYTAAQAWWLKASAYCRLESEDPSTIQNFDLVLFKDSVDSAALGKLTYINKMFSDTIIEDIDSLRAANSAVATNTNVEDNIKVVNELTMFRAKYGLLDNVKIQQLRNIAALCPFEEGPAVYTARALLRGIDSLRQEYMHECEKVYPSSVISRESKPEIENNDLVSVNNDFSVTPNPAKNMININHNGKFSDFYIEEISGKIVLSELLNKNLNTEQLDVSFLANGLYLAKLKIENDIKIVKLIINK